VRSLRLRVLLTIAAVSFATLACVGLFSSRTTTLDLERIEGPHSAPDVTGIVRMVEDAHARGASWSAISTRLAFASKESQVWRALLVGPRGGVLAASDPQLAAMSAVLDAGGTLHLTSTTAGGVASMLVLRAPNATIHDPRGATVALLYQLPEPGFAPPSRETIAGDITRSLWIAIAIAALAAAIAAVVLSTHILRPIDALTAAAQRLARGDLKARVSPTGADELGTLGRSFNAMADALARLERLREAMVADIAHELRTPLTHIRGRIEAIQDGRMEAAPSTIEALHADVLLLERLVRDLQDLSLADAGQLRLAPARVRLDDVARSVAASFGDVELRMPVDLPLVSCDPERLRQILHNLLTNARAHVRDGGAVWLAASAGGGDVRVTVHNDGVALDEEDLTAIFERFYRTDKSRSRITGGAGLGLAIVKQLVEASGGRVWAENTQPAGVSVVFTVPVAAA
jgi:two-component system sensor histidine kinase BaeS